MIETIDMGVPLELWQARIGCFTPAPKVNLPEHPRRQAHPWQARKQRGKLPAKPHPIPTDGIGIRLRDVTTAAKPAM